MEKQVLQELYKVCIDELAKYVLGEKSFDQNLLDATVRLQRAIMDTDILESIRIRICERKPDSKNNVYYPYIISKEDFLQNKNIIEKTRAAELKEITAPQYKKTTI